MTEQLDSFGRSPLHYAAAEGDAASVRELLASGLRASLPDSNGWTPLHFAAQGRSPAVAELLLAAGSQVDAIDRDGNSPLLRAVFNSRGEGELINLLRAAGADPLLENCHGQTPVGLARLIANYDLARHFADLPPTPTA